VKQQLDELAEKLGRAGRFDQLAAELDRFDPDHLSEADAEEWFELRGIAELRQGNKDSLRWFEQGLERVPPSGRLAFSYGQALEQRGRWDEALAAFLRVAIGAGPEQQRLGLTPVPASYLLAIARYCYLWGAFDEGGRQLEPLLELYGRLRIADDTFLYIRQLPYVNEVLETKCALALLGGDPPAARETLNWAETTLTDMTVDEDSQRLDAWVSGNWRPVLESIRVRMEATDAAGEARRGFNAMNYAAISSRSAPTLEAGLQTLNNVQLSATDFQWLRDVRTLATIGLADRFRDRALQEVAVTEFLGRQKLLFEPHHAFYFGLLDVQEPLRANYQTLHREP